ncbi:MAG: heat-inducible transcriptional repressor HrcA [Pseudomonadota bacterium]
MTAANPPNIPNERAAHLLKVLIERYIRDGQPVGSRTLSRDSRLELSPATIRNVMSDLEMMGLIAAPHTSAGRVPTPLGYRMFVDSLIRLQPPSAKRVSEIECEIGEGKDDPEALLARASLLLSRLTKMAGVVAVPKSEQSTLRQIEFLPLSDNRVLAILVLNEKEVQNRILNTSRNYSESELRMAANFVNQHFAGRDLDEVRASLLSELDATRDSMNQAMLDVVAVAGSAFDVPSDRREDLLMAGETRLMEFAELSDLDRLRALFEAFQEKRLVLDLLDRSIEANGIQIFIGEESGYDLLENLSVVTAPYVADDTLVGVLGVIGPTRMDYERVIPVVDVTAKLLSSALNSR